MLLSQHGRRNQNRDLPPGVDHLERRSHRDFSLAITNVAADHPERLKKLIKLAEAAHSPIRPGEIYDRKLIDKDRLQAPHQRNLSRRKAKEKAPLKER